MIAKAQDYWRIFSGLLGRRQLWLPVAFAYLLVNLTTIDDGGTNANARFATLRAMGDELTWRIDNYQDWTLDWARTPDGHVYSNKAPGPTLIAFPVFWAIDRLLFPVQSKILDEKGRRQAPRGIHKVAITTIFQVIPFLFLCLLLIKAAYPQNLKRNHFLFCAVAMLFGNTAAVLMNSYVGNPFAALWMVGLAYAYLKQKPAWMAFCFGWMVLSEYLAGALLLPFLWLVYGDRKELGWGYLSSRITLGAALPAALWCWYHITAFGGVFALPFQFEVAAIVGNVGENNTSIWGGITSLLPNPVWLFELLFGFSRGILFTQPWILLLLAFAPACYRRLEGVRLKRLFLFSLASFLVVLWFNAGFPGWHGGGSPGPRYMAAALPLLGLFVPALLAISSPLLSGALFLSLMMSFLFRALVYATWILPPPVALWPYYLAGINSAKEYVELTLFILIIAITMLLYRKIPRELTL
jgi:hypothetical protein